MGLVLCMALAFIPAAAAEREGVETIPAAAAGDLDRAEELYRGGDYSGALQAFARAEAVGARSGLLYYRMGYCKSQAGDHAANLELKNKAIPYFERQIKKRVGGPDPYYYLAAVYYQDLGDAAKGDEVTLRAVKAAKGGKLGKELAGDQIFRVGRLYEFAKGHFERPPSRDVAQAEEMEAKRLEAYRRAVEKLSADPEGSQVYLTLALTEVGKAARAAGDTAGAIEAFGQLSNMNPLNDVAGSALLEIALAASREGDLETANKVFRSIRGPDGPKTQAQYGMRLAQKALDHGKLPEEYDGQPIVGLDRGTLERGIQASAAVLREAILAQAAAEEAGVSEADVPDLEEVERQRGLFLAMLLSYMNQGHLIREFVVANQLIPFLFR